MSDVGLLPPRSERALEDLYVIYERAREGADKSETDTERTQYSHVALKINGQLQVEEMRSLEGSEGIMSVAGKNQIRILKMQAKDLREDLAVTKQESDSN
jgi:hypothetical protein